MIDLNMKYFECECESAEHTLRIISEDVWDQDFPPELYVELQLNQRANFFRRCWLALRYIFGYECKFGHWDNISIRESDLEPLIVLFHQHKVKLHKYQQNKKNYDRR